MIEHTRLIHKLRNGNRLHIGEREDLIAALNACEGINLEAVPELLATGKEMADTCRQDDPNEFAAALDNLMVAIAKVEGK